MAHFSAGDLTASGSFFPSDVISEGALSGREEEKEQAEGDPWAAISPDNQH